MELEKDDARDAARYFKAIEHLRGAYDFVNLRVGGRDNFVDLNRRRNRGLTFEAPRHSLMAAIRGRVFDDLLIGNYMRTTLHGSTRGLYPHFTPYVAKYADNGGARTKREVKAYMAEYRRRAPLDFPAVAVCAPLQEPSAAGLGCASHQEIRGPPVPVEIGARRGTWPWWTEASGNPGATGPRRDRRATGDVAMVDRSSGPASTAGGRDG